MSSILKENETLTASPEPAARTTATAVLPGDVASRPQPVALEVPVAVNGARTVDGSDKREPFSESTKTVLVFSNGAVIRLSSAVAPGQLLFLTNEKTKKEVVCQVVKSKNYRNVSGYVELEFTEQVVGFWGMRFPGDRIGSQPGPIAATTAPPAVAPPAISVPSPKIEASEVKPQQPVVQKPIVPAAVQTVAPVTPKLVAPVNVLAPKPVSPAASALEVKSATIPPNPPVTAAPPAAPMTPMRRASDVKLLEAMAAAPPAAKVEPAAAVKDNTSDALKLEAARLQEQLSSLLFTEAPKPAKKEAPVAVTGKTEVEDAVAKLFEIAKSEPVPLPPPVQATEPAKITPATMKSQLELEEVKIPAWLEPLARNVAAPASTEELIEREKSKHATALAGIPKQAVEPTPLAEPLAEEESPAEVATPTFGGGLSIDEIPSEGTTRTRGSNKLVLFGALAAGIVLAVVGGTWYMRQGTSSPQASVTAAAAAPVAPAGIPANSLQPTVAAGGANPVSSAPVSPKPTASAAAPIAQPAATLREVKDNSAAVSPAAVRNAPPAEQPKKPALGAVHLATPTVKHGASDVTGSDVAPAIGAEDSQIAANNEELGAGFVAANSKQPAAPAAPLPVGGDVKPAKMVSSVSPTYPTLAKSQHISGDVKIDALIDVNGRVTTMKIVSGPTLLHQSAMDALRQWKYQPATLDGKPVPMHLTITIQFRLQ